MFDFGECVTIIDCMESMKMFVSDIKESYKYTIIGHMENSDGSYLLLHIVQCWRACAVNEEKRVLPMVT